MSKHTVESILAGFNRDINYHDEQMKCYPEESKDWLWHLAVVDTLTTYRWKLESIIKGEQ